MIMIVLAAVLALAALLDNAPLARAQAGSAMDLVNEVNAYRAASGLEPYGVDGTLMSQAQSHSEYQASILDCTHTRADGSSPGAHGISAENIACGPGMSVQTAIYSQWTDHVHISTMLGPSSGLVGAGMATSGDTVYYTLAVKRIAGDFNYIPQANPQQAEPGSVDQASAAQAAAGPVFQEGMPTSTPNEDGSIAHIIKYGETLISIAEAYSMPLADLISMNGLDPNAPVYYEGQVLIIRNAFTATPFVTSTFTPRPATRTPQPSRTPRPTRTATVPVTPEPTGTATSPPLINLPTIESLGPARPLLAYTFIGISTIGLLVLLLSAFTPSKKDK